MPAPSTTDEFIDFVRQSGLVANPRVDDFLGRKVGQFTPTDTLRLAQTMVFDGLLTKYQAEQLLAGRHRNFIVADKYKLLERLGRGGMAMVFLCEHLVMKRLVALKILPMAHAKDRELLGRFHREARALSQLRHPNIVGAYDVDHAGDLHFLVMEYVDGGDLDQVVRKAGPFSPGRAAHYIRQAARGLQHAHESGLVHRDVKPGNLLVDRAGTVKLLDLGLARIFHESSDDLTTGRDARTVLGTVDYLAPEQALNSHDVDIRADIYGLGATFYYLLSGKGLFEDGTVAQKLSWHLHRPPTPITDLRGDLPAGLIAVMERMLSKRPDDRHQAPEEVEAALLPWTQRPIAPPLDDELPKLSRAAREAGHSSGVVRMAKGPSPSPASPTSPPGAGMAPTGAEDAPARVEDLSSRPTLIIPTRGGTSATRPPRTISEEVIPLPSPVGRPAGREAKATSRPWRKARTAAAAVASAVALGIAGSWALSGRFEGAARPPIGARLPGVGPDAGLPKDGREPSPPVDQAADATMTVVTLSGQSRSFPTLREAIRAARSGDRVVVAGTLIREAVELSDVDGTAKDLTIEGVGPRGGPVRWRSPRDLGQGRALLEASGLEGLRVKGFHFDGQGKVAELVRLSGKGAGSTLEDLRVQDAARAGIVLRGWSGASDRPATLRHLHFATADEAEAAIQLEPDPDRPDLASGSIRLRSCRFIGPYRAALAIGGPASGLDVEHCRFSKATDGVCYKRTEARWPLRLRLSNNTFADLQRGLHYETTPPASSSEIAAVNNVFAATTRISTLDRVSVQPARASGRWIWTDEGKKSPSVPPGDRMFRKTFDLAVVPARATLDIGCDEAFTVWINDVEVGKSPTDYFTQRIFAYDVAGRLRKGKNVIAVKGTNQLDRIDSKWGTTAGLMAQVVASQGGRESLIVRSDETWKFSDQAPEGWTGADFADGSWAPARPWPDGNTNWPWAFAVWDSAVLPQLKAPLEPLRVAASGNIRDYKSWEGYPTLDSERVVFAESSPPRNPTDDATFLRLPKTHPLFHAGPGGTPVGVFDAD